MTERTNLRCGWRRIAHAQVSNNRFDRTCVPIGIPAAPGLALLDHPYPELMDWGSDDPVEVVDKLTEHVLTLASLVVVDAHRA